MSIQRRNYKWSKRMIVNSTPKNRLLLILFFKCNFYKLYEKSNNLYLFTQICVFHKYNRYPLQMETKLVIFNYLLDFYGKKL
jgi:hypothetical protein